MSERREPTISTYTPSKEELTRHPSQSQANPRRRTSAQDAETTQTPVPSAAHSPAARPVREKSAVGAFALVLALAAAGAAGFLYWQLDITRKTLAAADLRIAELEGKFQMTDDEVNASTEAMQAKLKWADSEIRKLWVVSYETNKKAIADNKERIDKLSKSADEVRRSVDAKVKDATQSLAADLRITSELVEAQQASMNAITQQGAQITQDFQAIREKLSALETAKKEMERRIQTNEQAIEAIDAFRRNVNQQLLQLKGGA